MCFITVERQAGVRSYLNLHTAFTIACWIRNVLGISFEKSWSIASAVDLHLIVDVEVRVRHEVEFRDDSYVQPRLIHLLPKGKFPVSTKIGHPPFQSLVKVSVFSGSGI